MPTAISTVPAQLAPHCFKAGAEWTGNSKGRPLGSKARVLVEKAETKVTKKYLARCLDEANPNVDANLRHAIDKILPDAGRTDTLVSVRLSREDVIAELRRRGIAPPD